jgi:hypothetical protein
MRKHPLSSISDILKSVSYNPDTGEFIRYVTGRKTGGLDNKGYGYIKIKKRRQAAHRVAWLVHYKDWPQGQIDHINNIKTDNRISNLRLSTSAENNCNRGPNPTSRSGVKGVHWHKRDKRWRATIKVNRKRTYLGNFKTLEEAAAAYKRAAIAFHGQFARVA